ncbi:hypothetical protein Bca101_081216 [Brassica carinata]
MLEKGEVAKVGRRGDSFGDGKRKKRRLTEEEVEWCWRWLRKKTRRQKEAEVAEAEEKTAGETTVDTDGKKKLRYIDYFMHRISLLQHYEITPVVVLDGGHMPCKADTGDERQRQVSLV